MPLVRSAGRGFRRTSRKGIGERLAPLKDRAESEGRSAVADIGDRAVFRFAEESEGRSAAP